MDQRPRTVDDLIPGELVGIDGTDQYGNRVYAVSRYVGPHIEGHRVSCVVGFSIARQGDELRPFERDEGEVRPDEIYPLDDFIAQILLMNLASISPNLKDGLGRLARIAAQVYKEDKKKNVDFAELKAEQNPYSQN